MVSSVAPLTLQEFRTRYAGKKPHFEYWHGEPVQKAKPTQLHGFVQLLAGRFLTDAGYFAGSEVELRIDPDWEPVPDVIAVLEIRHPYPTRPVDVVVEILSPGDEAGRTLQKCREYARIGIRSIFVLDPDRQDGWSWNVDGKRLEAIDRLLLPNGQQIDLIVVWNKVNQAFSANSAPAE